MSKDVLEREVAMIGDLSREELVVRWQKAYGCVPPRGINRNLLERSAAWHLQAGRLGGLSTAARAMLRAGHKSGGRRTAAVTAKDQPGAGVEPRTGADRTGQHARRLSGAAAPLAVGTRLMREWNGRMHVVDVTAQGILFDGKVYRSLSAVARRITGTHWSGPRFFGL